MAERRVVPVEHEHEMGALATMTQTAELAPFARGQEVAMQIQAAAVIARQFPRNEDVSYQGLMRACRRPMFAKTARYAFPRAGQTISGPSVWLMREAARVWGNMRYGLDMIRDDDEARTIRGWAWDLESNVYEYIDETFKKLIQRRPSRKEAERTGWKDGDPTPWITPDERDLREMTLRRGAVLVRNAIRHLLPSHIVEDALDAVEATLEAEAAKDPDATKKAVLSHFDKLNVPASELELFLGHAIAQSTPNELKDLRGIAQAISGEGRTWSEILQERIASRGGATPSVAASEAELLSGARPAPFEPPGRVATQKKSKAEPGPLLSREQAESIEQEASERGLTPDDLFGIVDELLGQEGKSLTDVPVAAEKELLVRLRTAADKRKNGG